MAEKPYIIAGGGIRGLAAALRLAKAGKHSLIWRGGELCPNLGGRGGNK